MFIEVYWFISLLCSRSIVSNTSENIFPQGSMIVRSQWKTNVASSCDREKDILMNVAKLLHKSTERLELKSVDLSTCIAISALLQKLEDTRPIFTLYAALSLGDYYTNVPQGEKIESDGVDNADTYVAIELALLCIYDFDGKVGDEKLMGLTLLNREDFFGDNSRPQGSPVQFRMGKVEITPFFYRSVVIPSKMPVFFTLDDAIKKGTIRQEFRRPPWKRR